MRLGIFISHPIQYFAPLWRGLAKTPGLDVKVHFFSDHSIRGGVDPGFGVPVAWDTPLLGGYEHEFITRDADITKPRTVKLRDAVDRVKAFDWVMISGYMYAYERQIMAAANRSGVPVIMRGEYTDARERLRPVWFRLMRDTYLRRFYRGASRICYIGSAAKKHLRRLAVPEEKLFFSPYSVDSEEFESQFHCTDRSAVRKQLGIPPDAVVALFSGKLIERKAPSVLLSAAASLADELPRLRILFVGDGPLRSALEREAGALLGHRVTIAGFINQTDLGKFYRASDFFILPSFHESWGLVVNEAMQFGLPVIVSDGVECRRDLVLEGKTGWTFPCGDRDALCDRIRICYDDQIRNQVSQAARAHIAGFAVERSVDGIRRALGLAE